MQQSAPFSSPQAHERSVEQSDAAFPSLKPVCGFPLYLKGTGDFLRGSQSLPRSGPFAEHSFSCLFALAYWIFVISWNIPHSSVFLTGSVLSLEHFSSLSTVVTTIYTSDLHLYVTIGFCILFEIFYTYPHTAVDS